ncbi:hypothetical protein CLAVI_000489 [Candidatus Clavichlamydia salmonicola]|uniref:hypothetical protein n=1 Tax=Candidatus Clavichlamydia salmonicola TaxID=469812 RepID=UPI001890ECDB|nr:hypothetical protein [Candidatus Clavichlamydia salmonicola]MBF5050867.1 hypothetical protein [Candidatus Clavichlamydia salmonicola]
MIYINTLLSHIGLQAPSSPSEVVQNIINNSRKIFKLSIRLILGSTGIYTGAQCLSLSPSLITNAPFTLVSHCIPAVIVSTCMYSDMLCGLFSTHGFFLCNSNSNPTCTKVLCLLLKNILVLILSITGLSVNAICIHKKIAFSLDKNCSSTSFLTLLTGILYSIFYLKTYLYLIAPIKPLPIFEDIEMTAITTLSETNATPEENLLQLIFEVDLLLNEILEKAIEENDSERAEITMLLELALNIIQTIIETLNKNSQLINDNWQQTFFSLIVTLKSISIPLSAQHMSIFFPMLDTLHKLEEHIICTHNIDLVKIRLIGLQHIQLFCPPPDYSDDQALSSSTIPIPKSKVKLILETPPPYSIVQ